MTRCIGPVLALALFLGGPATGIAQVTRLAAPPTVRMTRADLKALHEVQAQSERRVAALAAQLPGTPAGAGRVALEQQIARAKLEGRLDWLAALGNWARAHGNPALAAQAEASARQLRLVAQPPAAGPDLPREKGAPAQEGRP